MSCKCGGCEGHKDEKMEKILSKYAADKSNLIQILNEVQEAYGYIPKNAQFAIIIGEEEMNSYEYQVKCLSTQQQEKIPYDSLVEYFDENIIEEE